MPLDAVSQAADCVTHLYKYPLALVPNIYPPNGCLLVLGEYLPMLARLYSPECPCEAWASCGTSRSFWQRTAPSNHLEHETKPRQSPLGFGKAEGLQPRGALPRGSHKGSERSACIRSSCVSKGSISFTVEISCQILQASVDCHSSDPLAFANFFC